MLSVYIIPAFISAIIISCVKSKVPVYDSVIEGAEDGLKMLLKIIPTMVAIMTAVSMLRASGALEAAVGALSPLCKAANIPPEIVPMMLLRPISGSGAFGILADDLTVYGPDSRIGNLASVIMGSTETTFYTLAVYFGSTNVKDIKRAVPCAVLGDVVGAAIACLIVK